MNYDYLIIRAGYMFANRLTDDISELMGALAP
jgi:hypothetical protein